MLILFFDGKGVIRHKYVSSIVSRGVHMMGFI